MRGFWAEWWAVGLFAGLLLLTGAAQALAPEPNQDEGKKLGSETRLAVLNLDAGPGLSGLAGTFADALQRSFHGQSSLVVVERRRIAEALREQGLGLTGAISEDTAVQVGELLGAQQLVVGSLVLLGDTLRVDARRVDAESGEVVAAAHVEFVSSALELAAGTLAAKLTNTVLANAHSAEKQNAVQELARALASRVPQARGRLSKVGDLGWTELDVGSEQGVVPGLQLGVFGKGLAGHPERRGVVTIEEIGPKHSAGRCKVETFPAEIGDQVEAFPISVRIAGDEPALSLALADALKTVSHFNLVNEDKAPVLLQVGVTTKGQILGRRHLAVQVLDQTGAALFELESKSSF